MLDPSQWLAPWLLWRMQGAPSPWGTDLAAARVILFYGVMDKRDVRLHGLASLLTYVLAPYS